MKRRDLLVGFAAGAGFTAGNAYLWQMAENSSERAAARNASTGEESFAVSDDIDPPPVESFSDSESVVRATVAEATEMPLPEDLAQVGRSLVPESPAPTLTFSPDRTHSADLVALPGDSHRSRVLEKVRNFNGDFVDDIYLSEREQPVLHSLYLRFQRAERLVGHGNYNLLGFDELFRYGKRYSEVGDFDGAERALIEKLFFTEAENYGFYGEKVTKELTAAIPAKEAVKIPYSGHYLLKGESTAYYEKLRKDIGDSVILTSGIRGNVKQMHLFVAKCLESGYNLSKASRSLAPPGHSYHGIGDFDVGRVGWGYSNFTDRFAETDEFKRMQDLGYVQIRYTKDNHYGVRFEPWHIKVV